MGWMMDTTNALKNLNFMGGYSLKVAQESSLYSPLQKYQLLERLKGIVVEINRGKITIDTSELIPKMLAVGRTRGTPDFESAVKELLATLARRIPSSEYNEEFESFI